jgi:outer membrane protein OmpA-like peptidoglycan-associated protein
MLKKISVLILALTIGAITGLAQDNAQLRSTVAGQKYKIKGVVVAKDTDNSFVVRDATGVDTRVVLDSNASVRTNGGFLSNGDKYAPNTIVRGLNLSVEGRGDSTGAVAANKVRFDKDDLQTARAIDTRVGPAEERITVAEQNAQRMSGQIDELMAISNAAKGGAKAAQETADAAVAGVNATNKRITDLDDYVVQTTATVNFRVGSAVLSPEGKAKLDEVASSAAGLKGYMIEVTGYASSDGSTKANKSLSERREKAVREYLIDNHNISLRRFTPSYGFGELQAVADNSTLEGREQNRRVEVKLLVSRGINQNVEVKPTISTDNTTNNPGQ